MNRAQGKFRQRVFIGALTVPTAAWLLLSAVGIGKYLDYDTGENRVKHEISDEAGMGEITQEVDSWISDRVPFRSILLSLNNAFDWILELPYNKIIEPILLKSAGGATGSADTSSVSSDNTEEGTTEQVTVGKNGYVQETPDSGFLPVKYLGTGTEKAIQGRNGWLFYANVLTSYEGLDLPTESEMETYLNNLNEFHSICEARGINQIFMYLPNKESIYSEYMPDCEKGETSRIRMLEEYAQTNYPELPFEYFYDELEEGKSENLIYLKRDTHWTSPGAAIGVSNMYRMLGLQELDLESLTYRNTEGGYGDLFYLANASKEEYEPEDGLLCNYKEDIDETVVREDNETASVQKYTSDAPGGEKLVIVGDSFVNTMLQFLRCDFSSVYYVCWDSIDQADWSMIRDADYLVVESVERNIDNIAIAVETLKAGLG